MLISRNISKCTEENYPCSMWNIPNHVVVIMGWCTENGALVWIVRNSWGKEFGDGGYIKIECKHNRFSFLNVLNCPLEVEKRVTQTKRQSCGLERFFNFFFV